MGTLAGCAGIVPSSGPSAGSVRGAIKSGVQIVDVTSSVAGRLQAERPPETFPEDFRRDFGPKTTVEPGDVLEVVIMEAPPASLFGNISNTPGGGAMGAQSVTFPGQAISSSGIIYLPFAGEIHAAGRTIQQIEDDITDRLKAKANQPQVLVRMVTNNTNYVTVLGAGTAGSHISLTAARERLLDALTKAGGSATEAGGSGSTTGAAGGSSETRYITIRVTRGGRSATVPLDTIIRDPRQNLLLQGGDVITVMHQPYNFVAMGALSRNGEIPFEGPSISLAQALARVGSLNGEEANIRGVFVFRFESPGAIDWPETPVRTAGGKVRVLYCLDLSKPESFFAAKSFPVCDGDLIYAAHAPALGLEKILGLVGSVTNPAWNGLYQGTVTANAGGL